MSEIVCAKIIKRASIDDDDQIEPSALGSATVVNEMLKEIEDIYAERFGLSFLLSLYILS
jgi:hypothetical protein